MYLGLDIGTSAVKAVLIDESGALVAQSGAPLEVSRPQPLWSEQMPADWWHATGRAVAELAPTLRRAVRAIGLSGQMHGATVLDRADRVLRPAILWNDGRSAAQCAALEAAVPTLATLAGNRAMPGFTAPKILWLREHEPAIYAAIARVVLPKDYVRLLMTGTAASDVSDAAGTLWLDVAKRRWSEPLLAATGLDVSHMPTVVEGTEATGTLRGAVSAQWGLNAVPVYGGGGDNAAGAVGVGVVRAGEAFLSLGTSGVLFLACDGYRPDVSRGVHTFCHAVPGRWHQMSVMLSAASCLDWAVKVTGYPDAATLLAHIDREAPTSGPELFLPYLSGERTPHNDPHVSGALFGLTHDSSAARIGRAVLEGVAFAFRDGLDALAATGNPIDSLSVIGGGSRSALWARILAATLNRPLVYREASAVGAAFGAARLARIGHTRAAVDDAAVAPPIREVVMPEPTLVDWYASRLPTYRALYAPLQSLYRDTAHV